MKKKLTFKQLFEIYLTFFQLGCISFGGGYAMLSLIEREVVERKKWIDEKQITDVFALSGSLPGAIAMNASAMVGYTIGKIPAALVALIGNLTPSVIIVLCLSAIYEKIKNNPMTSQVFLGITPVIIAMIIYAGIKIGKTAITNYFTLVLAILSLVGSTFFGISPIAIIIVGAILGIVYTLLKSKLNTKKGGINNVA